MVIELFYAYGGQERGEPYITAHVFVKVENIAYHKKVWVQGRGFRQLKNEARYLFQLDDKHEVWYGTVDEYMKASSCVAFDIECIVDEKLYRDGTFAIGFVDKPYYKIQGKYILLGSVRVLLKDANLEGNKFWGTIYVSNVSYRKKSRLFIQWTTGKARRRWTLPFSAP